VPATGAFRYDGMAHSMLDNCIYLFHFDESFKNACVDKCLS
jgi:hypothetical protein